MGVMDKRKAWQNKLNEGRWAAILWPEEWGGRAATTSQQVIYTQVMAKYRTPGIFNANGIVQIGPSIIAWGTEDQKARWLPGILDATEHWCQGFSEPQAGSDLANLRTTAILVRRRTHYVVNGQKIWISSAQIAKWGLFLMRTDPTAISRGRKHEGITDVHRRHGARRASTIRPIREITGDSLFCEVFFTDVKIPVGDRLGDEGNGWLVSMGALGQERVGSAGPGDLDGERPAHAAADREGRESRRAARPGDPRARREAAHQIEYTRLLIARALSKVLKGEKGWPEVPLAKLQWGYISLWLAELALDVLGPTGALLKGAPGAIDGGVWARDYVWQRYTTIGAGPTEVQKNIIADRALKLER